MIFRVRRAAALVGATSVPGDKSISHRALLLGAVAQGKSRARGWLGCRDTLRTLGAVERMGVRVERDPDGIMIYGKGLRGLKQPADVVDCGGSGTTIRLLMGLVAGQDGLAVFMTGNESLRRRPMSRISAPLASMGSRVMLSRHGRAPLAVEGKSLMGREWRLHIPSAQVKSALILAGIQARSQSVISLPVGSRDHTERMLKHMGAYLTTDQVQVATLALHDQSLYERVTVRPVDELKPLTILVPGDPSSAAFLHTAAAIIPGSRVKVMGQSVNQTRLGFLEHLILMGANTRLSNEYKDRVEPAADVEITQAPLRGVQVGKEDVVRMIDEVPLLAVAATQAAGSTTITGAGELRVKECDRIEAICTELQKLGAHIRSTPDGFEVEGGSGLRGARVSSHGDHRIAMALAVAGAVAEGETVIEDVECVGDSFPGFVQTINSLSSEGPFLKVQLAD